MELLKLHCSVCGGSLQEKSGRIVCEYCGTEFTNKSLDKSLAELRSTIKGEMTDALLYQKEEQIANIRANLYAEINSEYLNTDSIIKYSLELKKLLPDDFQANFCSVACGDDIAKLNKLVCNIDIGVTGYVDIALKILIKLLKPETLLATDSLITRAYEKNDIEKYKQWMGLYQTEAQKVEDGVYDVTLPRDVFIAYKSEDIERVMELVSYLEQEEGMKCFVAARNLQHGRVGDYLSKLQQAMDSCRAVVLVSSKKSRQMGDARDKELPYIQKKDMERAPSVIAARGDYKALPKAYKKPRAEFVIEEYGRSASEEKIALFFDGYERCYDVFAVAKSLVDQFDANNDGSVAVNDYDDSKVCKACGTKNDSDVNFCKKCGKNVFCTEQEYLEYLKQIEIDKAVAAAKEEAQENAQKEALRIKREAEQEAMREAARILEEARAKAERESATAHSTATPPGSATNSAHNTKPTSAPSGISLADEIIERIDQIERGGATRDEMRDAASRLQKARNMPENKKEPEIMRRLNDALSRLLKVMTKPTHSTATPPRSTPKSTSSTKPTSAPIPPAKPKSRSRGDYFGLSYIISVIFAIIPATAWIFGIIIRFSEGKIISGILRVAFGWNIIWIFDLILMVISKHIFRFLPI